MSRIRLLALVVPAALGISVLTGCEAEIKTSRSPGTGQSGQPGGGPSDGRSGSENGRKENGDIHARTTRFSTPQEAIVHLARARGREDQLDALRAADPSAVNYVFSHPGDGSVDGDLICLPHPTRISAYRCQSYFLGSATLYYVNRSSTSGYHIVQVEYIAGS